MFELNIVCFCRTSHAASIILTSVWVADGVKKINVSVIHSFQPLF